MVEPTIELQHKTLSKAAFYSCPPWLLIAAKVGI
jgi:hypothetical protein